MTLPELISEHKKLVRALKKGTIDAKEVKIQPAELKKYEKMKAKDMK